MGLKSRIQHPGNGVLNLISAIIGIACNTRILWVFSVFLLSLFCHADQQPAISIDGGPAALRDNVRQYLTISEENCSAPEWRLKALLNDARSEIENAAQAVGFYQLTFTSNLTMENNCWQLHLQLTPGPEVKVKSLHIVINGEGINDHIFKQVYEDAGVHIDDRLNHGAYENLKNRISTLATSHGYFDGRFDATSVKVDVENNSADIDIIYNTGARYRIGEIRLKQRIFDDHFIQRYLNFTSGDYYDTDKLLELKSIYNATNYFNIATASPDLQHLHDNTVDVDVVLEERKRHAYSGGVGIGTDTGPRIRLGYEDRYVNDVGHSVQADVSTSNIKTTAQVAYTIPMARPSYEFLKIYTGYDMEDLPTLYSNKKTIGTSYSYYQTNHWLHTYAVNLENETSGLGKEADLIHSHLIIPSVTFSRTETDGNPYPLRGWSFIGKLSGSPKSFGSDVSFLQLYIRAKYIQDLGFGRLLLRSELGATEVNDFNELPASVRFFAGGDNSVRGYDYKSLGPTDSSGNVIGGNNLWVNSIEYDYRIRPTWAVATFYDIGNAADNFHLPLQRGVGVGVRYISPIGPIRIDIARALDAPNGWHLHISMGPDL